MKKLIKKIVVSILLLGNVWLAQAQPTFFNTAICASSGNSFDWDAAKVIKTSDGGYIGIGSVLNGLYSDFSIIKLGGSGNIVWQKIYGTANDVEVPYSITQLNDGGFVICGFTMPWGGTASALIIKINSTGALQWSKKYGSTTTGWNTYAKCVKATSDGGFVVTGSWPLTNTYIIKSDANGNIQWQKTYDIAPSDWGESIETTSDGGFIVGGILSSGGIQNAFLLKTTSNGTFSWSKKYTSAFLTIYSAQQTVDGGYVAIGSSTAIPATTVTVKTLSDGTLSWSKVISQDGFRACIKQTADGGFIATANKYLFKLNSAGVLQWNKDFTGPLHSVDQTGDGGYILGGITSVFGPCAPFYNSLFVGKTDPNGVNCGEQSMPMGYANISLTASSLSATVQSPIGWSNFSVSQAITSFTAQTKCRCTADAGSDKVNTHYDNCCPNPNLCTGVTIGTPSSIYTYSWLPCNGTLSPSCNVAQPTASPCATTNYTLSVSGSNCISKSDIVRVTTNTWICCDETRYMNAEADESQVSIYPNPLNSKMVVEAPEVIQSITIIDLSGRVIMLKKDLGERHATLDLSLVPKGIYHVRILQNGIESCKKVIIE